MTMVLDITTLFPNTNQPEFGLFVEKRVRALAKLTPVHVAVGIGRFPIIELHPRYSHRISIPQVGYLGNTRLDYLRYLSVPRFFKTYDGTSFANSIMRCIIQQQGIRPTVLLAELAFPDGLAAMRLARQLKLPFVVTLRGHDINDIAVNSTQSTVLLRTLQSANAVVVVADALGNEAHRIGTPLERIHTVPNGVDSTVFGSIDKVEARNALKIPLEVPLFVSVGHLVERKGHHIAVAALADLQYRYGISAHLAIIGGPSEEGDSTTLVRSAIAEGSISESVRLLGSLPPKDVARWIAAADGLVLASSKEGRPNVVLEALCSGTPVVATRVWGTPELIVSTDYGILTDRDPRVIADAMKEMLSRNWNRNTISRWGSSFSWERTAKRLYELLLMAEREGPVPNL